jgi:hypothetical protein
VTKGRTSTTFNPYGCRMAKLVEASPMKSVAEELVLVRKAFRQSLRVYAARIDSQITQVKEKVAEQSNNPKDAAIPSRELRDMLALCRTLNIKPEKGRRKDFKKIESLLSELLLLTENW